MAIENTMLLGNLLISEWDNPAPAAAKSIEKEGVNMPQLELDRIYNSLTGKQATKENYTEPHPLSVASDLGELAIDGGILALSIGGAATENTATTTSTLAETAAMVTAEIAVGTAVEAAGTVSAEAVAEGVSAAASGVGEVIGEVIGGIIGGIFDGL